MVLIKKTLPDLVRYTDGGGRSTTAKVSSNSATKEAEKRNNLADTLERIKDEYIKSVAGDKNDLFHGINYNAVKSGEGERIAKLLYTDVYDDKRKNAENKANAKMTSLENKLATLEDTHNASRSAAENKYRQSKTEAENNAMEKGIQRSSIINELVKSFGKDKAEAEAIADMIFGEGTQEVKEQMDLTKDNLDATIESINQAEKDKIKSESDYQDRQKMKWDVNYPEQAFYDKDAYSEYRRRIIYEVYSYLANFDKEKALDKLQKDDALKDFLGKDYDTVMEYVKRRKK